MKNPMTATPVPATKMPRYANDLYTTLRKAERFLTGAPGVGSTVIARVCVERDLASGCAGTGLRAGVVWNDALERRWKD